MSDLRRILASIRAEVEADTQPAGEEEFPALDAALGELSRTFLPDDAVIEAMTADAEALELPTGWQDRAAARRRRLVDEMSRQTTPIGTVLRDARQRRGVSSRQAAEAVGLASSTWDSIEDNEAPAALLTVAPARVAQFVGSLGLDRALVARSLRASVVASAGLGYGYRPRQLPEDVGPATSEPVDRDEPVRTWMVDFLFGEH